MTGMEAPAWFDKQTGGAITGHTALQRDRSRALRERIQRWMREIPAQDRKERYTMEELVAEFKTSPGQIGKVLHDLGWTRRRRWRAQGPFSRYWVPPAESATGN